MDIKKHIKPYLIGTALTTAIILPFAAFAQTPTAAQLAQHPMFNRQNFQNGINDKNIESFKGRGGRMMGQGMHRQGTHGTVSAINGTTLTVAGLQNEIYTVDASAVDISTIKIGDKVGVQGQINTATIKASLVHLMPAVTTTK
ncbi:MAG: hypothetical protein WCK01_03830 [Candidatus Uhrbacteria bacterium]